MADGHADLAIELQPSADVDEEELAELAAGLRSELLDLDVDSVKPATEFGEAPADSKGVDLLAIGSLVVQFVLRPEVLDSVISTVRSWLGRQRIRSVKISLGGDIIELTGVSSAEQQRLIDLWIARHANPQ
jgi:hypothetical protein